MNFLFDESNGQRWTLSRTKAEAISKGDPDYYDYSHVLKLITELFNVQAENAQTVLDESSLNSSDFIVIADPFFMNKTEANLMDHIATLKNRVHQGASLLLIGDHHTWPTVQNINAISSIFGVSFGDVSLSFPGEKASISYQKGYCKKLKKHAINQRAKEVSVFGCIAVSDVENKYTELFTSPCGESIALAGHFGKGRVVAVGDSDMFSNAFLGDKDNFAFLADCLAWLGNRDISTEEHERLLHVLDQKEWYPEPKVVTGDIKMVQDEFSFDVSPYLAELTQIVDECTINPYKDYDAFFEEAEIAFGQLPKPLRRALHHYKRKSNGVGTFVLKGLPYDEAPGDTPEDCTLIVEKPTYRSEFWLTLVSAFLGEIFAFKQEKAGHLFQNICPTKGNERMLSSESSKNFLDYHTEAAFHPDLPDYLMLYCVRSDHERIAKTLVSHVGHMLRLLPLRERARLFGQYYRTGVDFSFGSANGEKANGPLLPILFGNPYKPFMKYDLDLMQGINEEAENSLNVWRDVCHRGQGFVQLNEGDLVVVDNRVAVHARTRFVPKYDGRDRWLQRAVVSKNLDNSAENRIENRYVIDTAFNL